MIHLLNWLVLMSMCVLLVLRMLLFMFVFLRNLLPLLFLLHPLRRNLSLLKFVITLYKTIRLFSLMIFHLNSLHLIVSIIPLILNHRTKCLRANSIASLKLNCMKPNVRLMNTLMLDIFALLPVVLVLLFFWSTKRWFYAHVH